MHSGREITPRDVHGVRWPLAAAEGFFTCAPAPNYFRFRISPDVTSALGLTVMDPEEKMLGQTVELLVSRHPGAEEPDAYERVLGDAMEGDATLFAREDYVEEAWRIIDPVLKAGMPVYEYEPGTWGPNEADRVTPVGGWHSPSVTKENWGLGGSVEGRISEEETVCA